MDVPYSEQLKLKDQEIRRTFSGLCDNGMLDVDAIRPIQGAKDPFHYRDKVTSPIVPLYKAYDAKRASASKQRRDLDNRKKQVGKARHNHTDVVTGIYAKGTHFVVPVNDCLLENPIASKVVDAVRTIMQRHGIEPYDEDTGQGFMRHVVVRVAHEGDEVLVTLVTNSDEFPHSRSFCKQLVAKVPQITSIVQNVNTRQTNVILGERFKTLYGPGFILDKLCGMSFRISPGAFYQVNSEQTEMLYKEAVSLAEIEESDSIFDAYCGTGTIGLVASKTHGNPLLGVDSSKEAIRDARSNASHNGVSNARFVAEDATVFIQEIAAASARHDANLNDAPDNAEDSAAGIAASSKPSMDQGFDFSNMVAFLDPPRSGSTEEFLEALVGLQPKKIVYISCNPSTQARDCEKLCESDYSITAVQPVDMFPHTPHIESIALLEKTHQ